MNLKPVEIPCLGYILKVFLNKLEWCYSNVTVHKNILYTWSNEIYWLRIWNESSEWEPSYSEIYLRRIWNERPEWGSWSCIKNKKKKRITKGVGKFTVCLGDGEIEKVHIWMIRKMASILSIWRNTVEKCRLQALIVPSSHMPSCIHAIE